MLKFIPIFGPWLCALVEKQITTRIQEQVNSNTSQVKKYIGLMALTLGVGVLFPSVSVIADWIINIMVMTYLIQGLFGLLSAIRFYNDLLDNVWVKLSGATLVGAIQAAFIPLVYSFILWIFLNIIRWLIELISGPLLSAGDQHYFDWLWVHVCLLWQQIFG